MSAAALPASDGLRAAMLDAVLAGRDLEHVAALAADHLGATVALVVPAAGVAVVAFEPEEGPDALLEELLDPAADLAAAEILNRARRVGADLTAGAIAVCAPADVLPPHRLEAIVRAEFADALVLRREDRVLALVPGSDARGLATRPFALVPFEPDAERLGRALREADMAAGLILAGDASPEEVRSGTHRLLLRLAVEHPEELRRFHAETIGPLAAYDAEHRSEIAATLRAYLAENCNMNATANRIYAHRHTVAYRLERVRELTSLDPFSHHDRERLGLGLKAAALLR